MKQGRMQNLPCSSQKGKDLNESEEAKKDYNFGKNFVERCVVPVCIPKLDGPARKKWNWKLLENR